MANRKEYSMNLAKANVYVSENTVSDGEKPVFHVTPPVGWMNDPNGFSEYGGKIHLFYQFHPYGTQWGPMHWGHVTSKDMLNWKNEPIALAPDQEYDRDGCFSGTALETGGTHVLAYTGVVRGTGRNGTQVEFQNQCLAVGDGTTYEKKGLILRGEQLPDGFSRNDFRDPKIWEEDGVYYLIAGSRGEKGHGQILLFSGRELTKWSYESVLADSIGIGGGMWECPDFFPFGGKHMLICSPQEMRAQKYEFHNGYQSIYFLGEYDRERHEFKKGEPRSLDYGLDFYAAQTTALSDGRRVLIGWMKSWQNDFTPPDRKWNGMMTLPRELELKGDTLIQKPVRELERYRKNKVSYEREEISERKSLSGIRGRVIDLTVEITGGDFREFTIDVANNDAYTTSYTYDRVKRLLETDRTYSGLNCDVVCQRKMRVEEKEGRLKLRFVMDRDSVEMFVNNGEQVSSTVICTPQEADGIVFSCDGRAEVNITKYDIVF